MKRTRYDEIECEDRYHALTRDSTDDEIIEVAIDLMFARGFSPRTIKIGIFHDVSESNLKRLASQHKKGWLTDDLYAALRQGCGPCPLPWTWKYKNTVGISTTDEAEARKWAADAMRLGYTVINEYSSGCYGPPTHVRDKMESAAVACTKKDQTDVKAA